MWVEVGGNVGQVRIAVKTRKEYCDCLPSRPRGGVPQGDTRGGGLHGCGGPQVQNRDTKTISSAE